MMQARGAHSSFHESRIFPALIIGIVGHTPALAAAWIIGRMFMLQDGWGFQHTTVAIVTFWAIEPIVALAYLVSGWIFIPRENRAARAALFWGWLLGLIAAWNVVMGS
jgi:hypothetical protein